MYSWQRAFDPVLASPQSWQLEDMVVNAKACFNGEKPQLSNWKIRLAIALGFDRERYNSEVYSGKFVLAYSFAPPIATVGDALWTDVAGDSVDALKTIAEKYPDPKALLIEGMEEAGLGSDPSALTRKVQ